MKFEFLDLNPFILQGFSCRASIPGGGFAASGVGIFLNFAFGKLWNYSRAVPPCAPGLLCGLFPRFNRKRLLGDGWGRDIPKSGRSWMLTGIGATPTFLVFPLNGD